MSKELIDRIEHHAREVARDINVLAAERDYYKARAERIEACLKEQAVVVAQLKAQRKSLIDDLVNIRGLSEYEAHGIAEQSLAGQGLNQFGEKMKGAKS